MNISQITDYLYISGQPEAQDAAKLESLGIRLIISMVGTKRPPQTLTCPPFEALWLRTYDTFLTPIPIRKLVQGVNAALPVITDGGRVLAHCAYGRHRGVAMGAAILIASGYSADDAMCLIAERRAVADPYAWYIQRRIRKFEDYWSNTS